MKAYLEIVRLDVADVVTTSEGCTGVTICDDDF